MPAKNSEAIFWRLRFTWPLRAGKRANANFACSEFFFCARRAAPCAGLAVFARPAAVVLAFVPGACLPAVRFAHAFFSYLLPFSVWLFPLKLLFICRSGRDGPLLSSEKKVDKDSQRGFAPSNPIPAPCGQSLLFSRCWPAYAAFGRKPPADGETLEKPRSKAQLFKRFCAKGYAAKLSFSSVSVRRGTPVPCGRSPLFSRCWPAYAAFGRKPPADKGNA